MRATHEIATKVDYLEVPDARIYYEVRGSGPVLLMMPGGPADAKVFERIAPRLAEWYTVVTYDPRGLSHSKLSAPPDDRQLFEIMADDASRLLAAVGRDLAFVFANSGGARVAFELITRHPGQVRALVAHEPPTGDLLAASERAQSDAAMQDVHDTYVTAGVGPAMRKFLAAIGEGGGQAGDQPGAPPEPSPEIQEAMASMQANLEFFLGHYWNAVSELDIPALRTSATRIIVAVGEDSKGQFPHKSAVQLAKRLGTQAVMFPGDHGGFRTYPAEFAERLHSVLGGKGGSTMTIKELYILANEAEQKVVSQIADDQWGLAMPEIVTHEPMTLHEVVRYHVWDDAWIPDILVGKTKEEVGNVHEHLLKLTTKELRTNFTKYNQRAIAAVRGLGDLDRTVHLSYGDFPAREYLQHNVSIRAFWSYDMAKLIGADTTMADDFVQALMDEFSPVVEGYRQTRLFPPMIEVASDASPQTKLLAMVGRE